MNAKELSRLEGRLRRDRERVLHGLQGIAAGAGAPGVADAGEISHYPLHLADLGTATMEREQALALADAERDRLEEIEDALDRLHDDPAGYGVCRECGAEIPPERLELIPSARLCRACQGRVEAAPPRR